MRVMLLVFLVLVGVVAAEPVSARSVQVDEFGTAIGATYLAGSGTSTTPLTYTLPFAPQNTAVAVQLCERQQGQGCGDDSDVILFDNVSGTGRLRFYSLHTDSDPAEAGNLADQYPNFPDKLNNAIELVEGPEGTNIGVTYTPRSTQPGYAGATDPVTYTFYSDGHIPTPEPTTLLLWGTMATGLGLLLLRRRGWLGANTA